MREYKVDLKFWGDMSEKDAFIIERQLNRESWSRWDFLKAAWFFFKKFANGQIVIVQTTWTRNTKKGIFD